MTTIVLGPERCWGEDNRCLTIIIYPSTSSLSVQAWIIPPDFDHSEAEAKVEVLCKHSIISNMHISALSV